MCHCHHLCSACKHCSQIALARWVPDRPSCHMNTIFKQCGPASGSVGGVTVERDEVTTAVSWFIRAPCLTVLLGFQVSFQRWHEQHSSLLGYHNRTLIFLQVTLSGWIVVFLFSPPDQMNKDVCCEPECVFQHSAPSIHRDPHDLSLNLK